MADCPKTFIEEEMLCSAKNCTKSCSLNEYELQIYIRVSKRESDSVILTGLKSFLGCAFGFV